MLTKVLLKDPLGTEKAAQQRNFNLRLRNDTQPKGMA
jgi:hypothetical protein